MRQSQRSRKRASTDSIYIDAPESGPLMVCLELRKVDRGYQASVQVGADLGARVTLPHMIRLNESETLRLGSGNEATLGEIVSGLVDTSRPYRAWFEERGQLEIGRKLFEETMGRIEPLAARDQIDLRIVTDDEHIMRLPWPLINRRGIFLIHEDWSSSLSTRGEQLQDVSLPASARILAVVPDPYPDTSTSGADHINDLRAILRGEDYNLGSPQNLVEVRSWQDFNGAAVNGSFDVVYFYGHGEGDADRTRLVFEAADGGAEELRSVGDFANTLRKMKPTPVLAYINCCHGDSSGLLGIGNQLGSFIPSVVTNRTIASVSAARKQACSFFRQVLLDSVAPHVAVATLYHELPGEDLDGIEPEWFTPVHHANYARWQHVSPKDAGKPRVHPNWRWLVDRKNQYGTTTERMRSIVNRQIKKRASAIVVYGEAGNGLRHFQERIRCFVHESVGIDGKTYKPSWPAYAAQDDRDLALARRSFMQIVETCGQTNMPDLMRDLRRGVAGIKAVTVLNHSIVSSPKVLNSKRLMEYLDWWDHKLETEIDDDHLFFLFAFYFEVPGKGQKVFQKNMKDARRNTRLQHIDVEILLPLSEIDEDDLLQFVDDHGLFIPDSRRQEIVDHIIRETDGQYERAIALLELIVHDEYHRILHEIQTPTEAGEDEDPW